jgi:hypothetical protein
VWMGYEFESLISRVHVTQETTVQTSIPALVT